MRTFEVSIANDVNICIYCFRVLNQTLPTRLKLAFPKPNINKAGLRDFIKQLESICSFQEICVLSVYILLFIRELKMEYLALLRILSIVCPTIKLKSVEQKESDWPQVFLLL